MSVKDADKVVVTKMQFLGKRERILSALDIFQNFSFNLDINLEHKTINTFRYRGPET